MTDAQHIKEHDGPSQSWLKENLFSNPDQRMVLEKGDIILTQGVQNQRLYYLESGQLSGYYQPENDEVMNLFTIKPHMLAGIYSFFYSKGSSYTTVKADKPSIVYYFDKSDLSEEGSEQHNEFLKHILPSIVNEIYFRQMRLVQSTTEKHIALKQLYKAEKMATLGQLAAGLAHELNNAIGVLHNKTNWITEKVKAYFSSQLDKNVYKYFEKGLQNGQELSTSELRSRKKAIQKKVKMDDIAAKKAARLDIEDQELNQIIHNGNISDLEQMSNFWEVGLALHDMSIAADHTSHVVKSIKELGAQDHKKAEEFDLNVSISKALALVKSLTNNIEVKLDLETNMLITANEGKFIQVWINLIKNAAEVLIQNNTTDPEITITSLTRSNEYDIFVHDNGPGIPTDIMTNIFQPEMTTKVSGISFGMGLGLSIVERIVVAAGGSVTVSSEPGNTTFKVSIPKS
ncbi:ATP-binding protein [Reichenbachiella versicolor]|uniref:ATP-binding protein n=1 Tax=Reichenbachiella versicolor TaxID=1821036 RepID=UPI000D6E061B|nr:ATP-binding protein [Reichenbachiella versicolor]